MNECHRLRRQLVAEAAACGQEFHDGYYLFESYEDFIEGWPLRSEHEDLVYEHFCKACADDRVREAFKAGLPINSPDVEWWDRDDRLYTGPFFEHDNESDSVRWCFDCGKVLSFCPTNYCLDEELDVYESDQQIRASDLLILSELVDSASGGEHEERALSIASACLKRFEVPAGQDLRSRLPTLAKIKQAWKRVCEPIYLGHD